MKKVCEFEGCIGSHPEDYIWWVVVIEAARMHHALVWGSGAVHPEGAVRRGRKREIVVTCGLHQELLLHIPFEY